MATTITGRTGLYRREDMVDKYIPNFILIGENGGLRNPLAKIGQPVNFTLGKGGPAIFRGAAKQVASKLPMVVPQAVSGVGRQIVGKAMGIPAMATGAGLQIGNYLYNTLPISNAGNKMVENMGDVNKTIQAQDAMSRSINPFVRNVMAVPGINNQTLIAYLEKQQKELGNKLAGNKPQQNKQAKNSVQDLPVLPLDVYGYDTSDLGVVPKQQVTQSVVDLPVLPLEDYNYDTINIGPAPNTQQIEYNQSVSPIGKLADTIGINYQDPYQNTPQGFANPQKIQWIMDEYGMTPDEYRNAMQRDMSRQYAQQTANKITGTNVTPYSELQAQKDVVKYLSEGYNTEQNLINAQRQLAEAYAMGEATGLPSSYFMDPEKTMQYIINPMIKGREDRLGYKTLLGNDVQIQQMKNEMEKYKVDRGYETDLMKMSNDLRIAQMNGDVKTMSSLLSSAVFDPNFSSTDFVQMASTVMTPEKAKELLSLKQYINMGGDKGQGRINNLNQANIQALLYNNLMGK